MPLFRLETITPVGKRTAVTTGFESESLIEMGETLSKKNPKLQFIVADQEGFILWPESLKKRTCKGSAGWGTLTPEASLLREVPPSGGGGSACSTI